MKVSQAFFNGWEFKTNNHVDYESLRSAVLTRIQTMSAEEKLFKIIKARSQNEWLKLYLRRIFVIFFNIAFLGGSCFLIIYTNINQQIVIQRTNEFFEKHPKLPSALKELAPLAPTIVLSACNGALLPVVKSSIQFEKWDFQYQRVNQGVWRIWVGLIVNLTIFTVIEVQRATDSFILIPLELIQFNAGENQFDCREDEASMMFLNLLITQTISKPVSFITKFLSAFIIKKVAQGKEDWKPEIE